MIKNVLTHEEDQYLVSMEKLILGSEIANKKGELAHISPLAIENYLRHDPNKDVMIEKDGKVKCSLEIVGFMDTRSALADDDCVNVKAIEVSDTLPHYVYGIRGSKNTIDVTPQVHVVLKVKEKEKDFEPDLGILTHKFLLDKIKDNDEVYGEVEKARVESWSIEYKELEEDVIVEYPEFLKKCHDNIKTIHKMIQDEKDRMSGRSEEPEQQEFEYEVSFNEKDPTHISTNPNSSTEFINKEENAIVRKVSGELMRSRPEEYLSNIFRRMLLIIKGPFSEPKFEQLDNISYGKTNTGYRITGVNVNEDGYQADWRRQIVVDKPQKVLGPGRAVYSPYYMNEFTYLSIVYCAQMILDYCVEAMREESRLNGYKMEFLMNNDEEITVLDKTGIFHKIDKKLKPYFDFSKDVYFNFEDMSTVVKNDEQE